MPRAALFLTLIGIALLLLTAMLLYRPHSETAAGKRQLVATLGLTDLALFSEARYTRHPSQADLFAAFQDFPAAFEHFPSGSLISPAPIGITSRIAVRRANEGFKR